MTYYHAGPRGLSMILPPKVTGAASTASYGASAVCRRDRVYVTTDFSAAVIFASLLPNGTVYEVEPVNALPDPDCTLPGLSFEAAAARIVREHRIRGKELRRVRRLAVAS
jgi:hypothetical protein